MTIIEAPGLYESIDAPVAVPYRFGLFSVLDFDAEVEHTGFGVTWESVACGSVGYTDDICLDPATVPLVPDTICSYPQVNPFTVYVYDDGSLGRRRDTAGDERGARDRFGIAEQYGVEAAVAVLIDTAAVPVASTLGGGTTEKLLAALGRVEQDLTDLTGAAGVIHMSRFVATMLGGTLIREAGQLRTILGTPVAAYGGGGDDPFGTTIYGTGPMKGLRSSIEVLAGSPNISINNANVIAQRSYVVGWDCGAVAASVTL